VGHAFPADGAGAPTRAEVLRGTLPPVRAIRSFLLVIPFLLASLLAAGMRYPVSDWSLAARAGHYMLQGHLDVFVHMPKVQMGPLALVIAGAVSGQVYMALVCGLLPLLLWLVTSAHAQSRPMYKVALVGGVMLAWPWAAYGVQGHADDAIMMLGTAMMLTALGKSASLPALSTEAVLVSGFLVAIAAKPVAILLLPLVFGHSRRTGMLAILGSGVIWAPFALPHVKGFLAAGAGQGDLWPYSVVALLGGQPHTGYPVWVRPTQLVGGLILCWMLVRWCGPAAAVAGELTFRVLLEPGTWNYYSTAIIVAGLMLDLHRGYRFPWVTSLAFLSFAATLGLPPLSQVQGISRLVALGGVLALAASRRAEVESVPCAVPTVAVPLAQPVRIGRNAWP
jgi:hypothetical protein